MEISTPTVYPQGDCYENQLGCRRHPPRDAVGGSSGPSSLKTLYHEMGNNVSTTAVETLPFGAQSQQFSYSNHANHRQEQERDMYSDSDPMNGGYDQSGWGHSQPPNRMNTHPGAGGGHTATRKKPNLARSEFGSYESDQDPIVTMNPKAAAEAALTEIDQLLNQPDQVGPRSNLVNARQASQSMHNLHRDQQLPGSYPNSSPSRTIGKHLSQLMPAPHPSQMMQRQPGPRAIAPPTRGQSDGNSPSGWFSKQAVDIEGLETEMYPSNERTPRQFPPQPNEALPGSTRQPRPSGQPKATSYDDIDEELINSIETEYTRPY